MDNSILATYDFLDLKLWGKRMKKNCVAIIFARGGSKGVPGKNIRKLGDLPLIAYSINIAKKSNLIDRVIVSTDDSDIAQISREYGAEVPFLRPKELATDVSPEWDSWRHALKSLKNDPKFPEVHTFVTLPPTSPFRSVIDVDQCIETFQENSADIVITGTSSERNPYFNMVKLDSHGYAEVVIDPEKKICRRQDAPTVYDMTTVAYVTSPEFIFKHESLFSGKVKMVSIPKERAIDIDTKLDFFIAEQMLKNGMINQDMYRE
ncbi:acylneuraminate cytidylyltransferase family protein [Bacteriovoracales bacterium]|nr:acylneuraminate cytidylyltransferase family protein [Bacteriovoracales bacterium]